jgi:hypothetical protein
MTRITARTSDAYTPCVVLHPDGREQRANVMHTRLMRAEDARAELAAGRIVWVAPSDVEAVRGEGA